MTTYAKKTWVESATGIDWESMQNMENGIVAIDTCSDAAWTSISDPHSNTAYQNATGKTIMVAIHVYLPGGASATAYIGATSSPTDEAAGWGVNNTGDKPHATLTLVVPPAYYFKVVYTSTDCRVRGIAYCSLY